MLERAGTHGAPERQRRSAGRREAAARFAGTITATVVEVLLAAAIWWSPGEKADLA